MRVIRDENLPPCSRCGATDVIISTTTASGHRIELCRHCDREKPAGGPLVRWFEEGNGRVLGGERKRVLDLISLMGAWQLETMIERGIEGYGAASLN